MDTNADGAVSADEHAAATKKIFAARDGNADGTVTFMGGEPALPMVSVTYGTANSGARLGSWRGRL
jgi:hypothetical protein